MKSLRLKGHRERRDGESLPGTALPVAITETGLQQLVAQTLPFQVGNELGIPPPHFCDSK